MMSQMTTTVLRLLNKDSYEKDTKTEASVFNAGATTGIEVREDSSLFISSDSSSNMHED